MITVIALNLLKKFQLMVDKKLSLIKINLVSESQPDRLYTKESIPRIVGKSYDQKKIVANVVY